MKAYRHVYLDFPDFTQESRYEVTSKVTFQSGVEDEIKTTVVCDDPYDAMEMVREFLLSKKDWLVTEVRGQSSEGGTVLVVKPEIPEKKWIILSDGYYLEFRHYSAVYTTVDGFTVHYGMFDTKEEVDKRCAELNKEWEEYFGEQK